MYDVIMSVIHEADDEPESLHGSLRPHDDLPFFLASSLLTDMCDVATTSFTQQSKSAQCEKCKKNISNPKVKLYCGCEYHLKCYKQENFDTCPQCNDKVIKTKNSDYPKCSICLVPLKTNIVSVECKHRFHQKCLSQWIQSFQNNALKCPLCRKAIHRPQNIV